MSPRVAAFFDIDNTLIDMKSMFSFQSYYFRHAPEYADADPDALDREFGAKLRAGAATSDRAALNRAYFRSFARRRSEVVTRIARDWFADVQLKRGDAVWIASARRLADEQRKAGSILVAVTGASLEIVAPIVEALQFDGALAVVLEQRDGLFTGELIPPQTIGCGKLQAIERFARIEDIDLSASLSCGDHFSDLPMLARTGSAYVVAGDPELERVAKARGWPVLAASSGPDGAPHI